MVGLTVDGVLVGGVALRDGVQPSAVALVEHFKARKIDVWMCTGDSIAAASDVANAVGIPHW